MSSFLKLHKQYWILIGIILVAIAFRVIHLSNYPSGFHIDEAQIGYNAFSILKTLRDENGNILPLHTGFFNEARPMLSVYLTVPWVYLFGLNIFSTRLTNALLGIISVCLTFLLVKKLFENKTLALLSSALLAISPWHIILSRSSADGALGLSFLLLSNLMLIYWIKKKDDKFLLFTFFSWILTYFSYTGVRPFIFLYAIFWIIYLGFGRQKKRAIILFILLILFIIFPVYATSKSGEALARYEQIGNITLKNAVARIEPSFLEDNGAGVPIFITRIFHNKVENSIRELFKEYFKYLNLNFLFLEGGYPIRFRILEQTLQYWFEVPFFLIGIYYLFRRLNINKAYILFCFLSGAVPAALTTEDSPNLQRAIYMLPALQIIVSCGLLFFYKKLNHLKFRFIKLSSLLFLLTFFLLELSRFIHQYTVHQPSYQPWHRNYEFQEIVSFVNQQKNNYDEVVISKLGTEPYLFFLFYGKVEPNLAQQLVKNRDVEGNWSFSNIIFDRNPCPLNKSGELKKNQLYGNTGECKGVAGSKVIKEVKRLDNTVAMRFLIKE